MAKLEVEIGADKSEFDLKIKEVESDIKDLSKIKLERIKLGLDTKEITGNIRDAKKSLSDLKTSLKDTGQSFAGMQKPVKDGSNTLMQFSRIAQDAPFGIMGIGNNITATAESFSYLSKSSGGAGNALKAVASSLLGTGGILLAVSLVTTALTIMSQNGITVGDVFNKLTGNFDSFAQSVSKAGEEAAKNASEQVANANAYVSAAKNINLSMSDRLLAVKKLQDEYPAYFGNLTKEQILNGDVANSVKNVTAALIAKAKAAAFSGEIAKLAQEEFKLREKEALQIIEVEKAQIKVNALLKDKSKLASEAGANVGSAYVSEKQDLRDIQSEIKANGLEQAKYANEINKATAASIKLLTVTQKQGSVSSTNNPQARSKISPISSLLNIDNNKIQAEGRKVIKVFQDSLGSALDTFNTTKIPVEIPIQPAFNQVNFDEIIGKLTAFQIEAEQIITDSIAGTFNNLGNSIGDALASGGNVLTAVGNSLLSSLGGFLSDMGGLLIKYGTLAVVKGNLDLAILTGGPVSIAAGIAAIGVGVALKAAGSLLGNFAKGGAKSSNNQISTGANVSSPNTSNFGSSSTSGGTVVFEISGQSLIGVLSNTLDRNSRLGGNLGIRTT